MDLYNLNHMIRKLFKKKEYFKKDFIPLINEYIEKMFLNEILEAKVIE